MPLGFQEVQAPRFPDNRHIKVVKSSAIRTGRLYPPGTSPGTHSCWRLSRPQGHSADGRIKSMKYSSDFIRIEPTTFRVVAQCLNQLRHRVPHMPFITLNSSQTLHTFCPTPLTRTITSSGNNMEHYIATNTTAITSAMQLGRVTIYIWLTFQGKIDLQKVNAQYCTT